MIKDLSRKDLIMLNVFNGFIIPRCFTYTKTVRKSIDRYWHRVNKVRRKNRWVPIIHEVECFDEFHERFGKYIKAAQQS